MERDEAISVLLANQPHGHHAMLEEAVDVALADMRAAQAQATPHNTGSPKLRENIIERLEAVQCIVASACSTEEAKCAWDELDDCIAQLRAGA